MGTFILLVAGIIIGASLVFKFLKFMVALGFLAIAGFLCTVVYFIYLA